MPAGDVAAVEAAARALRQRLGTSMPALGLVLGSGLGDVADAIGDSTIVPYAELPDFPSTSVEGHRGRIVAGRLEGKQVIALAGRFHLYEGHSPEVAALPVRMLHALGVRTLLLSNAAGGIRRTLRSGDLMLIEDHIDLMWRNPLVGPLREDELRFPDMSDTYDRELLALLRRSALESGQPVVEGVYAGVLGPAYETPAEVRMLERIGADAVGMSTVPEAIVARALGMRVAGVSCVTNPAAGLALAPVSHADVLETARRVRTRFEALVRRFIALLPAS
ncbi:MAG: purine-nucleoside phosphorylase [Gemmatimonadota bacterium]|nr:purine-nucleoside phosphorylase [Gemmatimonadota bacterium]